MTSRRVRPAARRPDIVGAVDDRDPRPVLGRRSRRGELIALDALAAVAYAVVFVPWPGSRWWWPALVAIMLAVAARRMWPVPAFVVALGLSVPAAYAGVLGDPLLAAAFVLYPVAVTAPVPRWEPTAAIGAVSAACLTFGMVAGGATGVAHRIGVVLAGVAALGLAWTAGRMVAERRRHARRVAAELAAHAVAEERLRIARELHDVVAHSIGVIAVKAGVANHVVRSRPDETHEALRVIESASRDALVELRRMLGVLRSDAAPADDRHPAPGMDGLADLAARASAAGVEVDLRVRAVDRLPDALGTTVYRIVQEALTNVVKHAARCRVEVSAGPGEVRIEVTDDGDPDRLRPPFGLAGHGLIGMRERVQLYGGTITCGPRRTGGFAVSVTLPGGRS
jgi:signal transduction histidine kinase